MTTNFFAAFTTVFVTKRSPHNDLMALAKTEYGNDWEWAFNRLLVSNGKLPTLGV